QPETRGSTRKHVEGAADEAESRLLFDLRDLEVADLVDDFLSLIDGVLLLLAVPVPTVFGRSGGDPGVFGPDDSLARRLDGQPGLADLAAEAGRVERGQRRGLLAAAIGALLDMAVLCIEVHLGTGRIERADEALEDRARPPGIAADRHAAQVDELAP